MSRIFDRFGVWIVLLALSVNALLRHDWVSFSISGVAVVGFAVMRPLDRRANRRTQKTQSQARSGPPSA